jgi:predicted ATPase
LLTAFELYQAVAESLGVPVHQGLTMQDLIKQIYDRRALLRQGNKFYLAAGVITLLEIFLVIYLLRSLQL